MCKNYTCRLSLALIFILIYITKFQAQEVGQNPPIFFRQTGKELPPFGFNEVISNTQAWQYWKTILRDTVEYPHREIQHFRSPYLNLEQENSSIVLYPCMRDIFYLDSAQANKLSYQSAFFTALSQSNYSDERVRFYLPGEILPETMDIYYDFDDGNGWRLMPRNQWISVQYLERRNRQIQSKITYKGSLKLGTTTLTVSGCENTLWNPQMPPWTVNNPDHPWRISGEFEGDTFWADAFTLLSDDQILDKPFIFVEGIDFATTHSQWANGDFGWCQFLGLDVENYPMLAQASVLYEELRSRGYDLILLDFFDGAADIRGNAQTLKTLITLCNQYKIGDFQLVVAGASMGGQVARVALSEMERDGIPHCAGAYISMDSPHVGANIPLGLQAGLWFLSSFSAEAETFVWESLDRTAAKQLLIYQWLDSEGNVAEPWKRQEYMNYLTNLNFPVQTLNVAIANGNILGNPMNSVDSEPYLLEENCDAFGILPGNEFQLRLSALPGDLDHAANTSTHVVIGDAIYTETSFQLNNLTFQQHHEVMKIPRDLIPLDYAAGGYRQSIGQLVDVLNATSSFTNNCGQIQNDQFAALHNFVPSASAWAIDTTHNANIATAYFQNNHITPFDRVYGCYNSNEPHVAINSGVMEFLIQVLDEIEATYDLSNCTQWGTFNFGEWQETYFPACEINQSDNVWINAQMPLHETQNFPLMSSHQTFHVRTFCHRQDVDIHNQGSLHIGDEQGLSTATLVASFGTSIHVFDSGQLFIHRGSTLILEEGTRLVISEGGEVFCEGRLILQKGSWVSYCGGSFQLIGQDSELRMEGGTVRVCAQQTLTLMPMNAEGGTVVMSAYDDGNYVDWWLEEGSELDILGQNEQDEIIRLEPYALWNEVSEPGSSLKCVQGKVRFGNEAKMEHRAQVVMKNVRLFQENGLDEGDHDIVCIANKVQYHQVQFYHLSLRGKQSKIYFDELYSVGDELWHWTEGTWNMHAGKIIGHGFDFVNMHHTWMFDQCILGGEGSDIGIHGSAEQAVSLTVKECKIFDYYEGIRVDHVHLNMSCSEISQCNWGITMEQEAQFIGNDQTGHNYFESNGSHLHLVDADVPQIFNGNNYWGEAGTYCIQGQVVGVTMSALANAWSGNQWQNEGNNIALAWSDGINADYGFSINWTVSPQQNYAACSAGGEEPMAGFLKSNVEPMTYWPNPGNQILHVRSSSDDIQRLEIFDAQGRLMHIEEMGRLQEVDTSHWSSGIYFLRWKGSDNQSFQKWVKN